jgi:hypothetical protein
MRPLFIYRRCRSFLKFVVNAEKTGQGFKARGCPDFRHRGVSVGAPAAILLFSASAHAICSEVGPVNFCFKWRHRDGSTVEFNPNGWISDDPIKSDWLSRMNRLYGCGPGIPPGILSWLQEECELIEVNGPSV